MRVQLTPTHLWSALPLALALAACFGTSTGNPTENPGEGGAAGMGGTGGLGVGGEGGGCVESGSTPVQLDEQTELGFSAQQVLAFVEGTHDETLTWHPQALASYGPESGEHALTLTVTRKDTSARLTRYKSAWAAGGAEIALAGDGCSPALELDVHVELRSDEGALDETFDTTLRARSSQKVALFERLDHEDLGGSFEVTEFHQPRYRIAQLDLSATFTAFGTSGALNVVFEQPSEDGSAIGAAAGQGPLASWGPASCGPWSGDAVPLDVPVADFSADDALASIDAVDSVNVDWGAGAVSSASFDFALSGGACAQLERSPVSPGNPDLGTLTFRGTLHVRSQDGRLDAAWPVEVTALPDASGALDQVKFAFDPMRVPQQGTLQARYGVSGVDASSYDFVGASLDVALAANGALAGELKVTGYTNAPCSTEPFRDDAGTIVGSPGCMGATPTELARAQLSAP